MTTIACILLVGMVMKNAIMMVDYALDAERNRGLSPRDAILLAARLRARPITMTMLAAFLFVLANLISDILYAVVDPRIRVGS